MKSGFVWKGKSSMDKVITCINCPVGCRMTVCLNEKGEFLSVSGNTCPRGAKYAEQECTHPTRMLTAVLPVSGSDLPLSVKTSVPVPKEMIRPVMRALSRVQISAPVSIGDTVFSDILGTGADIVATRSVGK